MGPMAGLEGAEISPPPEFDPRTVQPIASRYTGYAMPAIRRNTSSDTPPVRPSV
jgi:hypothetical protein